MDNKMNTFIFFYIERECVLFKKKYECDRINFLSEHSELWLGVNI